MYNKAGKTPIEQPPIYGIIPCNALLNWWIVGKKMVRFCDGAVGQRLPAGQRPYTVLQKRRQIIRAGLLCKNGPGRGGATAYLVNLCTNREDACFFKLYNWLIKQEVAQWNG